MSEVKEPETQFVCLHPEGCRMVIAVKDSEIPRRIITDFHEGTNVPDKSWKPACPNCGMTMYRVIVNKEMML